MIDKATVVIDNIHHRRTIKPEQCITGTISDADIWRILECAKLGANARLYRTVALRSFYG